MTPRQRIRRIQRWKAARDAIPGETAGHAICCAFVHGKRHLKLRDEYARQWQQHLDRAKLADRLFDAELDWLCLYAACRDSLRRQPSTIADNDIFKRVLEGTAPRHQT